MTQPKEPTGPQPLARDLTAQERRRLNSKKICIIGAGAAGLFCAASLPRGTDVTILEQMPQPGKKLLATGNGRCNLTNLRPLLEDPAQFYHGDASFAARVLRGCSPGRVMAEFGAMGLQTAQEGDLVYPATFQAKSVLHILRYQCALHGARLITDCPVHQILCRPRSACAPHPYCIRTARGDFEADYVVLAAGGRCNSSLGSNGSGYALAQQLGHRVLPQYPALVQLCSSSKYPRRLKGTRVRAALSIEVDGVIQGKKEGEILFTDYGLSGICTMELSRIASAAWAAHPNSRVTAVLDLLPDWSVQDNRGLKDTLHSYVKQGFQPEDVLTGMLPLPLARIIAAQAGNHTDRMAEIARSWRLALTDTRGFSSAQVTCGGVDTAEVWPDTLESRLHPGLYLLGELLNVDGDCGGFNLQFAWACGYLAARDIVKEGIRHDTNQ